MCLKPFKCTFLYHKWTYWDSKYNQKLHCKISRYWVDVTFSKSFYHDSFVARLCRSWQFNCVCNVERGQKETFGTPFNKPHVWCRLDCMPSWLLLSKDTLKADKTIRNTFLQVSHSFSFTLQVIFIFHTVVEYKQGMKVFHLTWSHTSEDQRFSQSGKPPWMADECFWKKIYLTWHERI